MVLKNVRAKVESYWTTTKKLAAMMSVWGLIFSLVTITKLGVAFDYDDTLVFSSPAFSKAFAAAAQPYSPEFWSVVNKSYDLEQPKLVGVGLAWLFRIFGFKVAIIASRPAEDGEFLKKEWRRLAPRSSFIFAGDKSNKHVHLQAGNYLFFFGDSDSDITEARKANVVPIRLKRSQKSSYKEDYHPGTMDEIVIPLSEY